MPLAVLLHTGRVAAEATVERLSAVSIDAQVIDAPNVFVKLATGGNYRVRVAVPEEELARAREELARWEVEARSKLATLGREVQVALVLASLPAVVLAVVLAVMHSGSLLAWGSVVVLWIVCVAAWVARSHLRARRAALDGG